MSSIQQPSTKSTVAAAAAAELGSNQIRNINQVAILFYYLLSRPVFSINN
jgi:hypothetical protein